jgi:DNA invertase Pin-like site-specific DNA recombinase
MKQAVIYIRVSTKQQAARDGNPEGYSLPTQREACLKRAESLGAVVVEEYIDKDTGTAVSKRAAMQKLLLRVETQQDIDLVIVHKLDRWARNTREDLVSDFGDHRPYGRWSTPALDAGLSQRVPLPQHG